MQLKPLGCEVGVVSLFVWLTTLSFGTFVRGPRSYADQRLAFRTLAEQPVTPVAPFLQNNLNEQRYDESYWKYQEPMNKFGAWYKGDILIHIIPKNTQRILEFGSSGGNIINHMPFPQKYGVELNPASRSSSANSFPDVQVWERIEQIPKDLKLDVVYTTDVLEHVDCPICSLRELRQILEPNGMIYVHLRNEVFDPSKTFESHTADMNGHIYTWNPLLLTNMLKFAGYHVCNVVEEYSAWHSIDIVLPENKAACIHHAATVQQTLNCTYLQKFASR